MRTGEIESASRWKVLAERWEILESLRVDVGCAMCDIDIRDSMFVFAMLNL